MSALFLFIRAVISGGIATAVHFIVLMLCLDYRLVSPLDATMIGWGCGFLVNYPLQRYWTFNAQGSHSRLFGRYVLVSGFMFTLNAALFWCFSLEPVLHFFNTLPFPNQLISPPKNLAYLYAQILTTGLTFLCNFILNRYYTFKT